MTDEQFERLMKDAAETYNRPPRPPMDAMWASIERESFGVRLEPKTRRSLLASPWLRMAAVLVLGVAIGRATTITPDVPEPEATTIAQSGPESYELTTERYLGQTVALLVGLPNQLKSGRADSAFVARANESLTTLRVLMDSPAASDPRMRALFEDLELVLVQVVQMPEQGSAVDATLIRQAMQERDVMPRLRDAVAETPN